ncbi:TadE/TadG family type IV pilus assembly protein [Massilia sp. LXY-6]|uniref:TadE/TadG family type IV pilus assembly protein n=1 Tax=Massilia sp. LXY-6 TaxID=3379823 RepID=UPI003EE21B21
MKIPTRKLVPVVRQRQRGVAAIELAIILPLFIIALAPVILWARYMWHYTVAQKAAQDAARYLSTVSKMELRSKTLGGYAQAVANEIARTEIAELAPGEDISNATVTSSCDGNNPCVSVNGKQPPQNVSVEVGFNFSDPIFNAYLGPYGMSIDVKVVMRYVGN